MPSLKKTLVSIENSTIQNLDPSQGVRLIRDLLWAEATRLGLPRHQAVISADITVPDGGIDASIDAVGEFESVLVPGRCHYQIKTGESFKPWQPSAIHNELFGEETADRANLGPAVVGCLDSGAVYALITLGHDLTTERRDQTVSILKKEFEACGYVDPKVLVLGIAQIISVALLHPSLCLDLNGLGDFPFQTVLSWAQNSDMVAVMAMGQTQQEFVASLTSALDNGSIQHVRIVGEPGIGKSRLVLETILQNPNFSANTLYVKQASDFQNSPLLNELIKPGRPYSVLLVVDECDDADRAEIWRALKGKESIKLLTIDHGPEKGASDGMLTLQAPPLEVDQVEAILQSYIGADGHLWNWAQWCGGSARVAHALGENLKHNPADILREPATVPIWERFISGYGQTSGDQAGRIVLRHIALFEKFGARKPVQSEADFIANLVAKTDPSITRAKFDSIVSYYRQRRILQGDRTLRIVPPALRIFLWRDWWENYGASASITAMMDGMPPSLHAWFMRSFIYAHGSESARDIVKAILHPSTGLFGDKDFLMSENGSAFINVLAEADPASTLALLRTKILAWTDEELASLNRARRNFAAALEKIAVWKDHFRQAAKILLKLTVGEKSTYSNNSVGIFVGLFSSNNGPTEASLTQRVSLAKELLSSADSNERLMGLAASSSLLNPHGNSRIIGVEYQGLRPEIEFWRAKIWSDLIDPWRDMLDGLMAARTLTDSAWQSQVDKAILSSIEHMARVNVLHEELIAALNKLLASDRNFEAIAQVIVRLLRYPSEHAPEEFAQELGSLAQKMIGSTFAERLRRYVLVTIWEDDYEQKAGCDEPVETAANIRLGLAQEAVRDGLVIQSLPVLLSSDGHRTEQFGFDVATAQLDSSLDDALLDEVGAASQPMSSMFLSGFLRGVHSIDPVRWEGLANKLCATPERWILFAVACSGMTARIFERLFVLYQAGSLDPAILPVLSYSPAKEHVGLDNFRRLLTALLARRDGEFYRFAVDIAERTLCRSQTPNAEDEELAFAVLTDAGALADRLDTMQEHHWSELATRFRKHFPGRDEDLLSRLVSGSDSFHGIAMRGNISEVANKICRDIPARAWPMVAAELLSDKADSIRSWLTESSHYGRPTAPAISCFAASDIFAWIDIDPGLRALSLAEAIAPNFEAGQAGDFTRGFLERYGDLPHVGEIIMSNFWTGSWSGPRSEHLVKKRELARKWLSEMESPKVQDWLTLLIEQLNAQIENAQIMEERMF